MSGISKTVVSLQPGKMEEVTKFIDTQAHLVTELEGIIGFAVAVTGTDEVTIIGVYENTKSAEAASGTVQKVFSEMAPLMSAPPDRGVYSGVWFGK
tara:strand:- start:211 stop:498 length:288 start_codon:yes stop_codon:yes gene_type:complete